VSRAAGRDYTSGTGRRCLGGCSAVSGEPPGWNDLPPGRAVARIPAGHTEVPSWVIGEGCMPSAHDGTSVDKAATDDRPSPRHCVFRPRAAASRWAPSAGCRGITPLCVRAAEGSEQPATPARMHTLGPPRGCPPPLAFQFNATGAVCCSCTYFPGVYASSGSWSLNWGNATLHVEPSA